MKPPRDGRRKQLTARLEADGLIVRQDDEFRTTRRWQGAVARSAYRLLEARQTSEDLRLPLLGALIHFYPDFGDEDLVTLLEILLPLEVRALEPRSSAPPAG